MRKKRNPTQPGFNEAPANSPGSEEEEDLQRATERAASMRPRRIRRGAGRTTDHLYASCGCFNEAPANSPGSAILGQWDGDGDMGFNEAPANSPGSDLLGIEGMASPPSFNEAPANSPGSEAHGGLGPYTYARASMRPRRIRRGASDSTVASLSRSNGFNEAPANSPGSAEIQGTRGHSGIMLQ